MLGVVLDSKILLPLAVMGGVSAVVLLVVEGVWSSRRRAEKRLDELGQLGGPPGRAGRSGGINRVSGVMSQWLKKASPQLAKPLQSNDLEQASKLRQRLAHAGFRSEHAPTMFLALRVISALVGFFGLGGAVLLSMGVSTPAILRAVCVFLFSFFVPDILLFLLTCRRKTAIFLSLPDAIDLMVVCVEAGLGLDHTMRKVAAELRRIYPVIAYEFSVANMQIQMGVPRHQVLRDLGQRNGEDDLRGLVSVLIQANKFGSGIGHALRVQSDSMRVRRRQLAEEKAAKTAVKLIFPLVMFIFPAIFVVLVGPAAISMMRNLMPVLQP